MKSSNSLAPAPLLVEFFRGHNHSGHPIVERTHHGIIAIIDGRGDTIFQLGDIDYPAHMRSCAKPFQILPLFEMGFFDDQRFNHLALKESDTVLMMSSHAGQHIHTSRVEELLSAINLDYKALRCGSHPPQDTATLCELISKKEKPSELHNNCSGKHLAMILACLHQGFDRFSYDDIHHPLQAWIARLIAQVADYPVDKMSHGIDGCSLPSLVLPFKNLALMYARLSSWAHGKDDRVPSFMAHAFRTIWAHTTTYPEFLAGERRFDTMLIRASNGTIISKCGADGLLTLAVKASPRFPHGLGIAIKIADGDPKQQIRAVVAHELLDSLGLWPKDPNLIDLLPSVKNFRGIVYGSIKAHCRIPS